MKTIYRQNNGKIAIISFLEKDFKKILELSKQSVPSGIPFKIITDTDIPSDLFFSDSWEADFSSFDGTGQK